MAMELLVFIVMWKPLLEWAGLYSRDEKMALRTLELD
jgi:hypothetical protein